jgi:Ca2+-binding EF-hand superfamily protein
LFSHLFFLSVSLSCLFVDDNKWNVSIASQKLRSIILSKQSMKKFLEYDKERSGYLSRSQILQVFSSFGGSIGSFSQSILLSICSFFETHISSHSSLHHQDGLINYRNLCEFILENDLCIELERFSLDFYSLINGPNPSTSPPDSHYQQIRKWFDVMDKKKEGRFSSTQFLSFCTAHNLYSSSKEIIFALYSEWDSNGSGVTFSSFLSWMKSFYTNHFLISSSSSSHHHHGQQHLQGLDLDQEMGFVSLTLDEIQKKCWSFFKIVNEASGVDIREGNRDGGVMELVYDKFRVFDWKGQVSSGSISKKVFSFLIKMIGFPLTKNEIRMIATQFTIMNDNEERNKLIGNKIAYQHFLTWCSSSSSSSSTAVVPVMKRKPIEQSRQVINFMEKQLSRGIDLLSIFRRYDLTNSSKITLGDFCCAIHDLGLSSISLIEAKEIGETFHALSSNGSFISYQKIIAELLKNIDYQRQKEVVNVSPTKRRDSSRSRSREGRGENHYDDDEDLDIDPLDKLIKVLSHSGEQSNYSFNDLCLKLREIIEENYDKRQRGQIHRDDLWSILLHAPFHCSDGGLDKRHFHDITRNYSSPEGIDWVNYQSFIRSLEKRFSHYNVARRERQVGRSRERNDLSSDLMDELKAAIERLILKGGPFHSFLFLVI